MDALDTPYKRGGKTIGGAAKQKIDSVIVKIPKVKSMPLKIHELKNFKLANMWAIFKIADFERVAHRDEAVRLPA